MSIKSGAPPRIAEDGLSALKFGPRGYRVVQPEAMAVGGREQPLAIAGIAGLTHQLSRPVGIIGIASHRAVQVRVDRLPGWNDGLGRKADAIEQTFVQRGSVERGRYRSPHPEVEPTRIAHKVQPLL